MAHIRSRLLFTVLAVGVAISGSLPTAAQIGDDLLQPEQACSDPTDSLALFAERIGKKRIGYGLTPKSARIPGPTIEMTEGECVAVTLTNDTNQRLSMHAHGVDYTVASDGTPLNDSCVAPGRSRTYVFEAHAPITRVDRTIDPGSAGYWHYHDHCMGGDHGTAGIAAGLFGAFIVRRAGDPEPEQGPFVVVMSGRTINLKKAPNTPTFQATLGQRVEFVVIGHGNLFHTFHLHGHRWVANRTGLPGGLTDSSQIIDNRTVGPADSFGFQVIAGEGVGPGAWMYHCHVQGHSDAGMTGIFMVKGPGGQATQESLEALRQWRRTSIRDAHHH